MVAPDGYVLRIGRQKRFPIRARKREQILERISSVMMRGYFLRRRLAALGSFGNR